MSAKPSLTITPLGGELAPHTQESHIGATKLMKQFVVMSTRPRSSYWFQTGSQASSDLGANVFGHVDPKDV